MTEDPILAREVDARRALHGRRVKLSVLAPYGQWAGCGALRVLRLKIDEESAELVAGYERYERTDGVEARS